MLFMCPVVRLGDKILRHPHCSLHLQPIEPEFKKTKDRILNIAKSMIAEQGFHATTTAQLASKAQISEGTIYRHFQSKEDILITILNDLDEKYADFSVQIQSQLHVEPGIIATVLKKQLAFVAKNQESFKIVLSSFALLQPSMESMNSVLDRMQEFMATLLEKAMQTGIIPKQSAQRTAMVLMTMLLGFLELRLYWPEDEDYSADVVEFCRQALLQGT